MTSIASSETIPDLASSSLDYDKYLLEDTMYNWNLNSPLDPSDKTCAAAGSNGNTITFTLEPGVYNLAKSYLTFNASVAASGNDAKSAFFHATTGFFNRVLLTKATGGTALCDLMYANKYISAVARQELSIEQVSAMDSFATGATVADSEGTIGTLCNYDYNASGTNDWGRNVDNVITNSLEPKYLIRGVTFNQIAAMQGKVPLSMFFNTILALDRAFYIGERLTLQFTLDGAAAVGYYGTTATGVRTDDFGAVTISNAQFYLAMVSNQLIAQKITEKCMQGQDLLIPNVTYTLVNYTASTAQNPDLRITRSSGKYITKLYAWNELATTPAGGFYSISNCSTTKVPATFNTTDAVVKSYVSKLNGKQIENGLQVESADRKDSYINAKNRLAGSCITSARSYYYNYCIGYNLKHSYSASTAPSVPDESHIVGGMELGPNGEVRWQVQSTTASLALIWYMFAALDSPYRIQNGLLVQQ